MKCSKYLALRFLNGDLRKLADILLFFIVITIFLEKSLVSTVSKSFKSVLLRSVLFATIFCGSLPCMAIRLFYIFNRFSFIIYHFIFFSYQDPLYQLLIVLK